MGLFGPAQTLSTVGKPSLFYTIFVGALIINLHDLLLQCFGRTEIVFVGWKSLENWDFQFPSVKFM